MSQAIPETIAELPRKLMPGPSSDVEGDVDWRSVLELWLHWSDAQEQVTSQMFEQSDEGHNFEDLMDQLDRMRHTAVSSSERLLDLLASTA